MSKYNDNKTNSINDIYNNNINYNVNNVEQMTKINSKAESNNIANYYNIMEIKEMHLITPLKLMKLIS